MRSNSRHRIEIVFRGVQRLPTTMLRRGVCAVLERLDKGPASVCILLTRDEEIRSLNLAYRGFDAATDVLSFPAPPSAMEIGEPRFLGDVAIGLPFAARQARARGVAVEEEIAMLAIHGTLHLLGFEDEDAVSREAMFEQMRIAARSAGIELEGSWESLAHAHAPSEVSP